MAEVWGGILRGIGTVLGFIYEVVPSYGVAIIILTVVIRALLIPLTIKQIRSMSSMQKLQPELKRLQAKYKGDRQKLNEEVMKLYKEHSVNPFGGCLPLVMQAPVFIALYSVLRATIIVLPTVTLVGPAPSYTADELKTVVCRPALVGAAIGTQPAPAPVDAVRCLSESGEGATLAIKDVRILEDGKTPGDSQPPPDWLNVCVPDQDDWTNDAPALICRSALGTGHLPQDRDLFADVTADRTNFVGMHLQCSATQSASESAMRQCTAEGKGGFPPAIPYYALIAVFVFSTYLQSKQMASRATGQAAQQQQMMTRIMPVFLGFISLNIPAGVNVYWFASNLWTIGQQSVFLRKQEPPGENGSAPKPKGKEERGPKKKTKGPDAPPKGKGKT